MNGHDYPELFNPTDDERQVADDDAALWADMMAQADAEGEVTLPPGGHKSRPVITGFSTGDRPAATSGRLASISRNRRNPRPRLSPRSRNWPAWAIWRVGMMNDVALERLDAHLDAANVYAAKSAYYDLWERGLMARCELWAKWAELDAAHADYMEQLTEDTERLMAEMGW